jgi:hypothetical protein
MRLLLLITTLICQGCTVSSSGTGLLGQAAADIAHVSSVQMCGMINANSAAAVVRHHAQDGTVAVQSTYACY